MKYVLTSPQSFREAQSAHTDAEVRIVDGFDGFRLAEPHESAFIDDAKARDAMPWPEGEREALALAPHKLLRVHYSNGYVGVVDVVFMPNGAGLVTHTNPYDGSRVYMGADDIEGASWRERIIELAPTWGVRITQKMFGVR